MLDPNPNPNPNPLRMLDPNPNPNMNRRIKLLMHYFKVYNYDIVVRRTNILTRVAVNYLDSLSTT